MAPNAAAASASRCERAQFLYRIADRLIERGDEFARGWSIESGLLYKYSQPRLAPYIAGAFRQFADMAETHPLSEMLRSATGNKAWHMQEPVGVTAGIVPWNGPAALIAYKVAPALLAGCTVIVKLSPEAPTSGYLMAEIFEELGLPPAW